MMMVWLLRGRMIMIGFGICEMEEKKRDTGGCEFLLWVGGVGLEARRVKLRNACEGRTVNAAGLLA